MSQTFKIQQFVFALIILSNLLLVHIADASINNSCSDAMPVDLDATYRGFAADDDATHTFTLEIPSAGIALVEIAVPGASRVEPKLGSLGRHCTTGAVDRTVAMIERSIRHQVIAFRTAGTYFFRIASQDPRLPLGDYKLTTRFLAAETIDAELTQLETRAAAFLVDRTDFYLAASQLKSEVDEVDPDPGNRHNGTEPALSLVTLYSTDPLKSEVDEVDPDPGARHSHELPSAQLVLFEASSFPGPAHSEVDEVDPDPGATFGGPQKSEVDEVDPDPGATFGDPQKSEVDEVDPDPGITYRGNRVLHSALTIYGSTASKSEVDEVDPDPGVTIGGPRKSEVDEVDPDPGINSGAAPAIARLSFTLEDLDPARSTDLSLLQWLAELTWSGASAAPRDVTDRYKLLAYERQSGSADRRFGLGDLCQQDADDVADTFGCATALAIGEHATASLGNEWGDDSDIFTFTVAELETVRIETLGATDTYGALYDRSGRRLAAADGGGGEANFQIVETLEAGQYFVRVEGTNGSEGSFQLNVATLGW